MKKKQRIYRSTVCEQGAVDKVMIALIPLFARMGIEFPGGLSAREALKRGRRLTVELHHSPGMSEPDTVLRFDVFDVSGTRGVMGDTLRRLDAFYQEVTVDGRLGESAITCVPKPRFRASKRVRKT